MKMTKRMSIAAGLLLAAAACQLPPRGAGDSYTLQGDPWAARAADGAAGATDATSGDAAAKAEAKTGAADGGANADAPTVLEQLEAAKARVKVLEGENQQLRSDGASLAAMIEQLKQQNQNLAQLADANVESRAAIDQEMEKLRQAAKDLEARCRTLADDLLSERIQRVRVERELILAKVKEAESKDDGR